MQLHCDFRKSCVDRSVTPKVDIDLQLAGPEQPGFSRRPDLVIVQRGARRRVRAAGGLIRAGEVAVVAEIVSPGSRRTDHVTKRGEYADAGIPHYWIVDLDEPVTLIDCHLAAQFGYQDPGPVTGRFVTTDPFRVGLSLGGLLPG